MPYGMNTVDFDSLLIPTYRGVRDFQILPARGKICLSFAFPDFSDFVVDTFSQK